MYTVSELKANLDVTVADLCEDQPCQQIHKQWDGAGQGGAEQS